MNNYKAYSNIPSAKKRCIVFFFLLTLFIVPSFAQNNYQIRKIKFTGNKTFSKGDLLDNMSFHQSNIIQRWIQRKDASLYSDELMDADLERLTRFYQSQGFLNAVVMLESLDRNDDKKTLNIKIAIQENEPIKVDSISIDIVSTDSLDLGDGRRPGRFMRRLNRRLDLKEGSRFIDQSVYDDMTKMNNAFSNQGYVYARTNFDLDLQPSKNLTSIHYDIFPGIVCEFGETTIGGNKYIKEKYISRQMNYEEGQRYNQALLDKTRQQLYDLQLFRIVSISPQTDPSTQLNPIPIRIQIEEMPRWMTKFGVGWGTEDKFRAFADVTYRGLFGGTSRLNIYAKHSALLPIYVSASWIEPQFFLKKLSLTVNPYFKWENEPGYETQTMGGTIAFSYKFNDRMQASLAYYLERVRQFVESDDADIPNSESDKFLYNKSGLSASFVYSTARPVTNPTFGYSIYAGGKLNGYIFGGDFDYNKLWIDARKYQKVGAYVLAGRAMIGSIKSSDASKFIPVEDRFYSGGVNSNRGWARSEVGPKRESGTPLGGKSIIELNAEVRRHAFWLIDLAVFVDASNVWTESYHFRFGELNYAIGGGVRINTPIGPVRVDLGFPVWNKKHSPQLSISIGQAF